MKRFLPLFIVLIISVSVTAQNADEIKKNPDYIWGEAIAKTLDQADRFAVKDLVSQISTKVESSFSTVMTENGSSLEEFTRSAISTYSNIYLSNAKRIVKDKRKSVYVLRYMDKKEIDEIFSGRKDKIIDYTNLAVSAEIDLRISDAMRYYYWALALLTSHPDCNKIKYTTADGTEITLLTFIQSELDKILKTIRINITDTIFYNNSKSFILSVNYKGKPVSDLDYTFWCGNTYSNIYSVKDGLGIAEFFSGQADGFTDLRLKLEYVYSARSIIDPEVQSVLQMAELPRLKDAEISIPLLKPAKKLISANAQPEINSLRIMSAEEIKKSGKSETKDFVKSLTKINQAIISKDSLPVNNIFTEEGLNCYNKLISYGNAKLLPNKEELQYIKINDKTMVRSVPMLFSFPNNNRSFVEDVVYTFDSAGKICNINFALSDIAVNDILNKSERFGTEEDKYFLINFLESYKTAYSLENLEFISSVFSDDALIIVGSVLENAKPIDGMYQLLENQNVKYTRYSKEQYLEHLNKAFASKEFINIGFEENEVKKTGGDDKTYGIQIAQNYYSSNYCDKGYLFLMIDLNDSLNPAVYVRTWQPEKNSDGSVIGLEHFSIK